MRHLLNTLYVFTEDAYAALDGENVVVRKSQVEIGRVPLHTLESILLFSYSGASPHLMGACAERKINLSFFTPRGRFLARVQSASTGNVLLRKEQYRRSEGELESLAIARHFILGKIYNGRWVLERAIRDHALRIDESRIRQASLKMKSSLDSAMACTTMDSLRGIEGDAAAEYFSVFDELILRDKDTFLFTNRVKRPPTDPVNALLSLFYTVLASDCAAALEGVGLDAYVGMMHADRPGRRSLALDLMEELRPVVVDRFVLTSINNRVVNENDFVTLGTGEVRLNDQGRRKLFQSWQERKKETILHPFLKEKIPWGLVPHVQALLLARHLRGDLEGYAPFLWK